jgi:integrase
MLKLFRRHRVSCPHRSQNYRRCSCPIYVKGTLNHTYVRMSLDQTNWDAATRIINGWVEAGEIGQTQEAHARTVAETVKEFLDDATARGVSADTARKYRNVLEQRLVPWCEREQYAVLASIDLPALTQFRGSWTGLASITKAKYQETLQWFFSWCVRRKYLDDNPTQGLTRIKIIEPPTMPFTREQVTAIIAATDALNPWNAYGHDVRARAKAFVLLLRWTGLRIRDVATLEWSRVQHGRVFLYTQKTGTPVNVPLPPECVSAVQALPKRGRYVFWTGSGKEKTFVSNWQRTLAKVFARAGVPDGHAHRFRDTFAVECLLTGMDIADVSVLLGHSSVKITQQHYAPWVTARQSRLEAALQRTWQAESPHVPETPDTPAP